MRHGRRTRPVAMHQKRSLDKSGRKIGRASCRERGSTRVDAQPETAMEASRCGEHASEPMSPQPEPAMEASRCGEPALYPVSSDIRLNRVAGVYAYGRQACALRRPWVPTRADLA